MIIISESQCDTWECIHSSIFFMHPSIPHLHLVSAFALSLFLDYLNQLPLAPVKHCLAQVATPCLSDLDSWITPSLWVQGGCGGGADCYFLWVGTAASACKLWTFVTEQNITDQMWNQRQGRVSINPTKTPFKVLSVLWSLCGLMCRVEITGS